jgi:hypothetical protein
MRTGTPSLCGRITKIRGFFSLDLSDKLPAREVEDQSPVFPVCEMLASTSPGIANSAAKPLIGLP